MNNGSVSKSHVIFEIDKKTIINCELKRHLSPSLVGNIIRSLPINGNIHMLGTSGVYLETNIESGGERPKKEFKKGDIAFLSANHALCFFYKDTKTGKELTKIGIITDDTKKIEELESGENVSIYCEG
tara:strand:- start:6092 stop:6475 length:384 start_codon:yes stop_codon:yes gene_type:complete